MEEKPRNYWLFASKRIDIFISCTTGKFVIISQERKSNNPLGFYSFILDNPNQTNVSIQSFNWTRGSGNPRNTILWWNNLFFFISSYRLNFPLQILKKLFHTWQQNKFCCQALLITKQLMHFILPWETSSQISYFVKALSYLL